MLRTSWWWVVLLVACSEKAAPEAEVPMGQPPFKAAQIRAATATGRTYVWRVSGPAGPSGEREARFEAVDDDGATLVSSGRDEAGKPVGEERTKVTWAELEGHARFPAAMLTVKEETVTVPAGEFACLLYEVKEPDGSLARFWFAKDLPGAPVKIEASKDGTLLERRELVKHEHGQGR